MQLQTDVHWSPTPVKAVPASAQAKGSRYQGATEMMPRHADIETSVVSTASHARVLLISKTWGRCKSWRWGKVLLRRGKAFRGSRMKGLKEVGEMPV